MTPVTYTNLNKLLLIRDIQDIAKTYINDDRSYRWIWKNKIADVYHIGYVTFMNYISVPSINAKIDEAIAKRESLNTKFKYLLLSLHLIILLSLNWLSYLSSFQMNRYLK